MGDRLAEFKDGVWKLFSAFKEADQKSLQKALREQDFKGACRALGLSEDSLKGLLTYVSGVGNQALQENPHLAKLVKQLKSTSK